MLGLRKHWQAIRTGYWFLPGTLALLAVLAAFASLAADAALDYRAPAWLVPGGAAGARETLATIAASMITVAGVVFSITIVAFSLASQQFGPSLLRNFMRDTVNQLVLGIFVATFLFCVVVLQGVDEGGVLPSISISIALVLALLGLGVLIFFIHHIAQTVRIPYLLARVRSELERSIDRLYPESLGSEPPEELEPEPLPNGFERDAVVVLARADGYVQLVEEEALLALLTEHDLVLEVLRRPHDYVAEGEALVRVFPSGRAADTVCERVRQCIAIGEERTVEQDVVHGVQQIAQVALRALSPALNDPFTGNTCIDQLSATLMRLAGRKLPAPYRTDRGGSVRIHTRPVSFPEVLDAAFEPIRQAGAHQPAVVENLLSRLSRVEPALRRPGDRRAVRELLERIGRSAQRRLDREDWGRLDPIWRRALSALAGNDRRPALAPAASAAQLDG